MDLNNPKSKASHSGVIVLHELSTDSLILTKRNEHLRSHPGEVSFPGGIWEKGDKDLYATAVRELNEELGILEERLTLVKPLEVVRTFQGTEIHPWFVSIESIEPYHLNQTEVVAILSIPMELVKQSTNYKNFTIEKYGFQIKNIKFAACDELVWGATARIMRQLAVNT